MKIDKRNDTISITTKTHTIYIDDSKDDDIEDGATYIVVCENHPVKDKVLYRSINNDIYIDKGKLIK